MSCLLLLGACFLGVFSSVSRAEGVGESVPSLEELKEEASFIWWSFVPPHVELEIVESGRVLYDAFNSLTDSEFKKKLHNTHFELKQALAFMGWFRLHRMYGDDPIEWTYYKQQYFASDSAEEVMCTECFEDEAPEVSPVELETRNTAELYPESFLEWKKLLVKKQRSIRLGYTHGAFSTWYKEIKALSDFVSSSLCDEDKLLLLSEGAQSFLREIGFYEILEHRKFIDKKARDGFSFEESVSNVLANYFSYYIPYEFARIDIFKRNSYEENGRKNYYEFETLWADSEVDGDENYNLLALGLVSSGKSSTPTPSGEYQVFAIQKNWKNTKGDRMPGAFLLSQFGHLYYSSKALHGTNGYGAGKFGTPASMGCVRQYTNTSSGTSNLHGFVDVLWASLNPRNFSGADHLEGYYSWRQESPLMREVMREFRKRIKVNIYADRGVSRGHKAEADVLLRNKKEVLSLSGQSVLSLVSKLVRSSVRYVNPADRSQVRYGKYAIFDEKVQSQMFHTVVPKKKYYSTRDVKHFHPPR